MGKNKWRLVFVLAAAGVFTLGHLSGLFLYRKPSSKDSQKYPLLATRVQEEVAPNIRINFTELRTELAKYLQSKGALGASTSVYFEYLPTSTSIHLNETSRAVAASLMKVPAVMNLYMAAELGRVDLNDKITLKEEWLNKQYGTLYQKGAGYELTLREAAGFALRDSDNTAITAIWSRIDDIFGSDYDAMNYLDIEFELTKSEDVLISAKSYSSIFKCLYYACHTSQDSSQEILKYLTESNFNDRLVRDIPSDVLVAHKIGTHDDDFQSDCGIFYTEGKYVLCVMVKGSHPVASPVIAEISRIVYRYLEESNNPPRPTE